ncbi:MAG TPA: LysR family transcriptional regulator [Hyphomicrobiaceae bacterium]|nr:LysR family transcriptional regulator [Hyphomicrobiaceae bacterium]
MQAVKDLNKLNTFVRVAERRSFTKAARDLRTTPSVVSKHISELEDMLGFSLLCRSTHGVALTEVGERFFRNCLSALEGLEDFVVAARNTETGPYGTLRIQATIGFARALLAPLIPCFMRKYPHVRIELVDEGVTQNPVEYGCDVIISHRKPNGPGLIGKDIGIIEHVICAAPSYLKRFGEPRRPQELRAHNCLIDSPFSAKEWWFKDGAHEISVEVKGTFCSNSPAVRAQLAIEGLGIARVPRYTARPEIASGALKPILEDVALSRERIAIYHSKSKHLPAKTRAFVEFVEATLVPRLHDQRMRAR